MSTPAKDVIYIDVDDEITAIIDKVATSPSKIIALVLPKRATTLQSIVNMKLLKKAAEDDKKHLVLITNEAGLLPLAAATEMYVAKNLQTKPEIPMGSGAPLPEEADDEPLMLGGVAANPVPHTPQGPPDDTDDTIMLDNSAPKPAVTSPVVNGKPSSSKIKPMKSHNAKKVPNFNKFRIWIIIGVVALIALILMWYLCFKVLPRANVLVKTDSTAISANIDLTLSTSAQQVNAEAGVVPAKSEQVQKTVTQQAPATGQRNDGQKASGSIKVTNCSPNPVTLPAGTGFSTNGMTFISQSSVTIPDSNYTFGGTSCKKDGFADINVVAQNAGANYNIGSSSFSIANGPTNVSAQGGPMSGGSDQIVKIVQQSDIDAAKEKLQAQDTSSIKRQLQDELIADGLTPVAATFTSSPSSVNVSANVGDPADNVTVTENINYTMLGAKQSNLEVVVGNEVKAKIDTQKQSITDFGIAKATYENVNQSGANATMAMRVTAVAGPDIDTEGIKKQIAGKKSGDATKIIKSYPGVTDVDITYSPFWVSSIPGNQGKITVTIDEPQKKTNAD